MIKRSFIAFTEMSVSFEDVALLMATTDIFEDGDLLILVLLAIIEEHENKVPIHHQYERFDLNNFSDEECKSYFRFLKADIIELADCLGLPDTAWCDQGSKYTKIEGMCILLRRLSYPSRLVDLVPMFGRAEAELSMILNKVLHHIQINHVPKMNVVNPQWLNHEERAELVHAKGAPLTNIWGFIDGTMCYICRPKKGQMSVFNGHKRMHALKFQSVIDPSGILVHFWGPLEGRRHDSGMYNESGIDPLLQTIKDSHGSQMAIYGDTAYGTQAHCQTCFKGSMLTPVQEEFNTIMSKLRICVEWGFAKIVNLWAFIGYKRNLKVYLQPVGEYYMVAALLTNAHTCKYGSQTADYFGAKPPTLQEYFQ